MKCENCECEFSEPKVIHTTYSSYYGVPYELGNKRLELNVCPYCGSEEIRKED